MRFDATNVAIVGRTVELTLPSAVHSTQTVALSYSPGANPLQDSFGNAAEALSDRAVTNNTPPASQPDRLGGFTEAPANNDSVTGRVTATLTGDTFTAGVANGAGATVTNLPPGLTPSYALNDGRVILTLTLTPNAASQPSTSTIRTRAFQARPPA